eukprot:c22780_g1_i1 orf=57-1295(+)
MPAMATNKKKQKRRKASAFYDLNVSTEGLSQAERLSVITTALQLGYSGVALNHVVKGPLSDAHLCRSRPLDLSDIASAHTEASQSAHFHRDVLAVPPARRTFRQYDRLTVVLDTAIHASALNAANPVLRSYDLVAIRPTSQKVFDQACTHLEVDVISLDFLHRLPIRLKAASIHAALERGVFFEVSFSGAFQDVKARRELFANSQILQGLTRGRNIIVSSGARRSMDLRGPNDIANMGTMFGLSREAGKLSVSKNCEDAVLRGLSRKRTYKSAVIVERIPAWEQSGSDETWFDVPKVWDPLSNTKMGNGFLLPEKMIDNAALKVQEDTDQHTEAQTKKDVQADDTNISPVEVNNSEGRPHSVLDNDEEAGFLSIDVNDTQKGLQSVGTLKRGKGAGLRQEMHVGKHRKRKKV